MRYHSSFALGLAVLAGTAGLAGACEREGKRAAMRAAADVGFTEADADGSGGLDEAEFGRFGEIMRAKVAAHRFQRADANGDGSVTKAELEEARPRRRPMGPPL